MITYSEQIAQVSTALADPTRREIMEHVVASDKPLTARVVAEDFGLHVNAARMHLEKLVKGGILEVTRRRGKQGGRPAHHYHVSEQGYDLHLPPRSYKLLAEILAESISPLDSELPRAIASEAYKCGRKEAMKGFSPLAQLDAGSGIEEVADAWMREVERRGLRAKKGGLEDGKVEATFLSCPFGELSDRYRTLVCEVHRLLEEGFLSTAGDWRLRAREKGGCVFILERGSRST